jgi:hypothetical protein
MEKPNFRSILMQKIADRLNKRVEDLVPWQDYDPIVIDGQVDANRQQHTNPNSPVWTGD